MYNLKVSKKSVIINFIENGEDIIMEKVLFRPKLLYRKRVKNLFKNIFNRPIFLLIASIGYGKTTSIKRFLNSNKNIEQIWFSPELDEIDDNWAWQQLSVSMYHTYPELGKKFSNYGLPQNQVDIQHFIEGLKECVIKPTVLILDDFQEISSKNINFFIEELAYASIPNFHIVVISRTYPSFSYEELILKQYCYMAEQNNIAFNKEETKEFFELNGIELEKTEVETIFNYTDGWIAATYLSLFCYKRDKNFNNIDNCYYLVEKEVYDKFENEIKKILTVFSLIDSFTLEQAVYITGNKKVISVIKYLYSNNCFIKYNFKNDSYTLHMMLKIVASKYLDIFDIDAKDIFERCGQWYEDNKRYILAIKFYHKAQKYNHILNIMDRYLDYNLLTKAPSIIINAFDDISIDKKLEYPFSYILFIRFYIFEININDGKNILKEAKDYYENKYNFPDKNLILGEIALIERLVSYRDIVKMDKYLDEAYRLFDGEKSKIYNSNAIFNFSTPYNLMIFYSKQGQLYDVVKRVQNNFWKYNKITNNFASGYEYLIQAEYYYDIGEFEKAELLAYKARFKAMSQNQFTLVGSANFTLIRLAILSGKIDDLNDCITEIKNRILNTEETFIITQCDIILGYTYVTIGQNDKIPIWLTRTNPECMVCLQNLEIPCIIYSKFLLSQNNYEILEKVANFMLKISYDNQSILGIIASNIFASVAYYHLYGIEKAKEYILKAIDISRVDGVISQFLEVEEVVNIIDELNLNDEYVQKILKACKRYKEGISKIKSSFLSFSLTSRELDILNLVKDGYKNSEIAKHFSIASVTVEKLLSNIYKKLNVKNRAAAVSVIRNYEVGRRE